MTTAVEVANPYWTAVKSHVGPHPVWRSGPRCVDNLGLRAFYDPHFPQRHPLVRRYAWTITAPETVAFVAEHSGGRLVDPLAGTGYWGLLLAASGVDVVSCDLHPADGGDANVWHKHQDAWVPVLRADAVDAVAVHADRTLLLSWPPYDDPLGDRVLAAYPGNRVIYIGEMEGGCCGDDDMFARLDRDWSEIATHEPVQWGGMHDYVTVYERREVSA